MVMARWKRRSAVGVASFAALSVGSFAATIMLSSASSSGKQDSSDVLASVEDAIFAQQQIGALNATSSDPRKNLGATYGQGRFARSDRPDLATVTQTQIQAAADVGEHRIRHAFTGKQLQFELGVNAKQEQKYAPLVSADKSSPGAAADTQSATGTSASDAYVIDGGADNFKFDSVVMDDSQATVVGTTRTWLNEAVVEQNATSVYTPNNVIEFTAHLVKSESGAWQVDDYTWQFAPGSAP